MVNLEGNLAGYLGAAVAAIFYGSNYIIFKKYEIGDGIFASFGMAIGILLTGYAAVLFGEFRFVASGLLGGGLWALGNTFVPLAIKLNGLGLSFLLWSSGNLLLGYSIGKFGLFGLDKEDVDNEFLNIAGAGFGFLSLIGFFFIKPEDNAAPESSKLTRKHSESNLSNFAGRNSYSRMDNNDYSSYNNNNNNNIDYGSSGLPSTVINIIDDSELKAQSGNEGIWDAMIEDLSPSSRRILGVALASSIGVVYGVTMTPFQLWWVDHDETAGELDFAFSHFSGVFLTSLAITIIYVFYTKNRPQIFPSSFFPSIVCGIMWAVATCGWFVVNANLGMSVGFPLVVISPGIISSLFSVFLFKEITTERNLLILALSLLLNIACVICVSMSIE